MKIQSLKSTSMVNFRLYSAWSNLSQVLNSQSSSDIFELSTNKVGRLNKKLILGLIVQFFQMLGVNRLQRPPQVRGRGVAPATRALSRPASWRPINQDYDVSKLFVQEIHLGTNSITVMGESAEELAEKSMAAMLVYHQAGFPPYKVPGQSSLSSGPAVWD